MIKFILLSLFLISCTSKVETEKVAKFRCIDGIVYENIGSDKYPVYHKVYWYKSCITEEK